MLFPVAFWENSRAKKTLSIILNTKTQCEKRVHLPSKNKTQHDKTLRNSYTLIKEALDIMTDTDIIVFGFFDTILKKHFEL